jgi:hypothetical protein
MRLFSIEGKDDSPFVLISKEKNLLEISDNSTMKDTCWFYGNLLKWMIAFNRGPKRTETVNIHLMHINDSSLKQITHMFQQLSNNLPATSIEINWHLVGKSPQLLSGGRLLQRETANRVNLVSYQGDC